jgi:hypothetical protein
MPGIYDLYLPREERDSMRELSSSSKGVIEQLREGSTTFVDQK